MLWGTSCRKVLSLSTEAFEANDWALDGSCERYPRVGSASDLSLSSFEEGSLRKRCTLRTQEESSAVVSGSEIQYFYRFRGHLGMARAAWACVVFSLQSA